MTGAFSEDAQARSPVPRASRSGPCMLGSDASKERDRGRAKAETGEALHHLGLLVEEGTQDSVAGCHARQAKADDGQNDTTAKHRPQT